MKKQTPRIQITLTAHTRVMFQRLAAAQDRPVASVIAEFLEETAPALQNVVRVVESAKDVVRRIGRQEREGFAVAEAELLQHQHAALSALSGAEAAIGQLSLNLQYAQAAEKAGLPRRPLAPRVDPQPSNRGVNKTKISKNGTLGPVK